MSIQTLEEADRAKKAIQKDIHSYFKQVRIEEMLEPTKEEKRQWAFNTIDFGSVNKIEDITDDMVMECCQCHRKFLLENVKWGISSSQSSKYPYEPLCINYPHSCGYKLGIRYKGFRKQEEITQCPKHSKYKAFKAPTNGCQTCLKMYAYIKCISLEEAQKRADEQTQPKQTKKAVEVCWYCKNKRGHNCYVCHGNHS